MKRRDDVDQARARALTWQALSTPEHAGEEREDSEPPESSPDVETDAWRLAAMSACQRLVEAIERVWTRSDPALQARGVAGLLQMAKELDRQIAAMQLHPLACVRLARLMARHYHRLKPGVRELADWVCYHLDYAHPELEMLLTELLDRECWGLAGRIHESLMHSRRRPRLESPEFLEKLRRCIEGSASWATKMTALSWAVFVPSAPLLPTLRLALRMPHVGVRWRALALLLKPDLPDEDEDAETGPPGTPIRYLLPEEDLLFLLEDAVLHPPPMSRDAITRHSAQQYARVLLDALRLLRPATGARPLLRILEPDDDQSPFVRGSLDERWALMSLALVYPEVAEPYIAQWSGSLETEKRVAAAMAAGGLPKDQARPYILRALTDGANEVQRAAKELGEVGLGQPLAVDPLAAIPKQLLAGPPSDRLVQRAAWLHQPGDRTRKRLVEMLLAEAPDREALALLTIVLADDELLAQSFGGYAVMARWQLCTRIIESFGELAVDALVWLAERYPGAEGDRPILSFLQERVRAGQLARGGSPVLRELALRCLDHPSGEMRADALGLLAGLGLSPELCDRVTRWIADGDEAWESVAYSVRDDAALAARLAPLAQHAFEAQDLARCERLLRAAAHHPNPDFLAWVEQRSNEYVGLAPVPSAPAFQWPLEPAALALARACVDLLSGQKRLSDVWMEAALARPEHLSFQIAARECIESLPKEPQLALLRTALDSPARSGEAAAEAAGVLAHHGRLQPSDSRVGTIFARVHGEPRRDLLFYLLEQQTDVRPLRAPLRTLLLSEDLDDAYFVIDHLLRGRERHGVNELLRETLPAIRTGLMRTFIEKHLRLPGEVQRFWQDAK